MDLSKVTAYKVIKEKKLTDIRSTCSGISKPEQG